MKKYGVFISYRREPAAPLAKYLRDKLTSFGYRVFLDVDCLVPGKDFDRQLMNILENCQDFILILTPGALDRCFENGDWVRQELACALETGKNIIPVRYGERRVLVEKDNKKQTLYEEFHFPDNLPDDISAIRRKETIKFPNEYFFPALYKLTKSLHGKPLPVLLFRRVLPVLLALLLVVLAAVGLWKMRPADVFPSNQWEEGLLEESLAYSMTNLQQADVGFAHYDAALQKAYDYCQGTNGAPSKATLLEDIDHSKSEIEKLTSNLKDDDSSLMEKLRNTPEISAAELNSMVYCIRLDLNGMAENLDYLRQIVTEPGRMPDTNAKIIECYQESSALTEESYFVALNQTFVLVNMDSTPMQTFLTEQLPLLDTIYATNREWSTVPNLLKSHEETIYNRQQDVVHRLASFVGDVRQELDNMVFAIVKAQAIVDTITPKDGDTFYDNWTDMLFALGYQRTDIAKENIHQARMNVAALETPRERNGAEKALDSALLWIEQQYKFSYGGGCVIFYFNEDGAEYSHLRPGDILVALDGKPVTSSADFMAAWQQVAASEWDYTLLRADEHGQLQEETITVIKGEEHFDGHVLPLRPITFEEYENSQS